MSEAKVTLPSSAFRWKDFVRERRATVETKGKKRTAFVFEGERETSCCVPIIQKPRRDCSSVVAAVAVAGRKERSAGTNGLNPLQTNVVSLSKHPHLCRESRAAGGRITRHKIRPAADAFSVRDGIDKKVSGGECASPCYSDGISSSSLNLIQSGRQIAWQRHF